MVHGISQRIECLLLYRLSVFYSVQELAFDVFKSWNLLLLQLDAVLFSVQFFQVIILWLFDFTFPESLEAVTLDLMWFPNIFYYLSFFFNWFLLNLCFDLVAQLSHVLGFVKFLISFFLDFFNILQFSIIDLEFLDLVVFSDAVLVLLLFSLMA